MNFVKKNIKSLEKNTNFFGRLAIKNIINKKSKYKINNRLNLNLSNKEVKKFFLNEETFDFHKNFYVIGLSCIELIKTIYLEMSHNSTLTIIENSIDVLSKIFKDEDLSGMLKDSRVVLIFGNLNQCKDMLVKRTSFRVVLDNANYIDIYESPYLKSVSEKFIYDIEDFILNQTKYMVTNIGNDITDILAGFEYMVKNTFNIQKALSINLFKNAYRNVPLIIVSAGPSLDKNIKFLKNYEKDALIMAVDTTFSRVVEEGVVPDAISTIERYEIPYQAFYEGKKVPKNSVFIGPPVVSNNIFKKFDQNIVIGRLGEKFVHSFMDTIGYDSIELGISCAHVPFAFGRYVGADPIIFIGQDLAFNKNGKTHSDGSSDLSIQGAKRQSKTHVKGINGDILETTAMYKYFKKWFEAQILADPNRTYINATEGGALIEGTKTCKFKNVHKYFKKTKKMPLYQLYKNNISKSDNVNVKFNMIEFIRSLIENINFIRNEYQNKLEMIKNIQLENKNNNSREIEKLIKTMNSLRNEITNPTVSFFIQSITNTFYRDLGSYPVILEEKDKREIKFKCINYTQKLIRVFDSLIIKLNEMIVLVESGDVIE